LLWSGNDEDTVDPHPALPGGELARAPLLSPLVYRRKLPALDLGYVLRFTSVKIHRLF